MTSIVLALLLVGQEASQTPAPPVPTTAVSEKLECRAVSATGSRLRKGEVCLTPSEWEQRTKDDKKATRDMQDRLHCPRNAC